MTCYEPSTEHLAPAKPVPDGEAWPEIKAWRKTLRREILGARQKLEREERWRLVRAVAEGVRHVLPEPRGHRVGFYWPIHGELDLRFLVEQWCESGASAGVPVVVEKQAPVEFWVWRPGMRMQPGFWNIPQPPQRVLLRPDVLIVPLVGFDAAGYRLGYGGGYYDRTLAALDSKPLCIGVGLEMGRLETIYPQPHDIPMDVVVTEIGSFPRKA